MKKPPSQLWPALLPRLDSGATLGKANLILKQLYKWPKTNWKTEERHELNWTVPLLKGKPMVMFRKSENSHQRRCNLMPWEEAVRCAVPRVLYDSGSDN